MPRRITELEQKMIDDGWWLEEKHYTGKRSEKVDFYVYYSNDEIDGDKFGCFIWTDNRREKIITWGIPEIQGKWMTQEGIDDIQNKMEHLKKRIMELENHELPTA